MNNILSILIHTAMLTFIGACGNVGSKKPDSEISEQHAKMLGVSINDTSRRIEKVIRFSLDSSAMIILDGLLKQKLTINPIFFNANIFEGISLGDTMSPRISRVTPDYFKSDSGISLTCIRINDNRFQVLWFQIGNQCYLHYFLNEQKLNIVRDLQSKEYFQNLCDGSASLPYESCQYRTINDRPELVFILGEPERWVGLAHENNLYQIIDMKKMMLYEFVRMDNFIK